MFTYIIKYKELNVKINESLKSNIKNEAIKALLPNFKIASPEDVLVNIFDNDLQ